MRCCLKTPVIFSRHQQHTTTIITSKILVQCFSKDFFIFSISALKMGCCETMLRYIIFLINFVFFLASVAVIAIGAYIQIQMKTYLEFIDNSYIGSAVVLIVLGAIIMVVAFFGCCGACTENPCMMYTYGTLLALILIALIGVTVTIVVFKVSII